MRCPVITRGGASLQMDTRTWTETFSRGDTGSTGTEMLSKTRTLPFAPKMLFARNQYVTVVSGESISFGFGGYTGNLRVTGQLLTLEVWLRKSITATDSVEYTIIG